MERILVKGNGPRVVGIHLAIEGICFREGNRTYKREGGKNKEVREKTERRLSY